MKSGYIKVPGRNVYRAAKADCMPRLYGEAPFTDCCAIPRSESTDALMAGDNQCVCNNSPKHKNRHPLVNGKCQCGFGYTGAACDKIDVCALGATFPCQAGATCDAFEGGFTCICPQNWPAGENCTKYNVIADPGVDPGTSGLYDLGIEGRNVSLSGFQGSVATD